MSLWIAVGTAVIVVYAAFVLFLLLRGRREDARAVGGFVPDCVLLFRRLLRDERLPRHRRWLVAATLAYLAMPFDLVPDVIPVAGQLDDALVVALVVRWLLKSVGPGPVTELWPGPRSSLQAVLVLAGA